ncbi:hypothetical protein LCGC14_1733320, partial [marine sediment metagenome]
MAEEYIRPTVILGQLPVAGNIVLADGFEHLNNWTKSGGAGDSIYELDPSLAKIGSQSLY